MVHQNYGSYKFDLNSMFQNFTLMVSVQPIRLVFLRLTDRMNAADGEA